MSNDNPAHDELDALMEQLPGLLADADAARQDLATAETALSNLRTEIEAAKTAVRASCHDGYLTLATDSEVSK